MNYSSSKRGFPAGNPIANAFVIIVGALAIGASIVLGFFAFVILASILIVFSAIVGIRLWWFNRKIQSAQAPRDDSVVERPGGVIEGEYQVITKRPDDKEP